MLNSCTWHMKLLLINIATPITTDAFCYRDFTQPSSTLCVLQAHRAHMSQLPCQVVAAVPRQQADEAAAAAGVDPRRHSPFISFAMIAASEVGLVCSAAINNNMPDA